MSFIVQIKEDPRKLALLERIAVGIESIATAIGSGGVDQDAEAGRIAEDLNKAAAALTAATPAPAG